MLHPINPKVAKSATQYLLNFCTSVCAIVLLVIAQQGDYTCESDLKCNCRWCVAPFQQTCQRQYKPRSNKHAQYNVNGTLTPPLGLQMNLVQQKRVILDDKGTIKTVKRCPHLDT